MQSDDRYVFDVREICLGDALDDAAARWGDRIGWVFGDREVSFRAMRDEAAAVAASLLALGLQPGDVVALWMPNLPEFAFLEFGCAKAGAIIAAINTRSKSFELEHVLKHSDARVLVMVDGFLKHDFAETLAELLPPATRDTVPMETPAAAATSRIVGCPRTVSGLSAATFTSSARLGAFESGIGSHCQ